MERYPTPPHPELDSGSQPCDLLVLNGLMSTGPCARGSVSDHLPIVTDITFTPITQLWAANDEENSCEMFEQSWWDTGNLIMWLNLMWSSLVGRFLTGWYLLSWHYWNHSKKGITILAVASPEHGVPFETNYSMHLKNVKPPVSKMSKSS